MTAATKSTPLTAAKTAPERPAAPSRSQGAEPRRGSVSLPDGASRTLQWSSDGASLRLSCGGHVARAFVLTGPSRAVFDLSGAAPSRSHQLAASLPHVKGVRIGKQPGGTRVVVDLSESPRSSRQDGATLVLSF